MLLWFLKPEHGPIRRRSSNQLYNPSEQRARNGKSLPDGLRFYREWYSAVHIRNATRRVGTRVVHLRRIGYFTTTGRKRAAACLRSRRGARFKVPVVDVAACHGHLSSTDRCNLMQRIIVSSLSMTGFFVLKPLRVFRLDRSAERWRGEVGRWAAGVGFVMRVESHGNLYKFQTLY